MEQNSKSNIVKAFIDLKKGVLQVEGPQEFVEKYLNSIVKNCKPFSKAFPKPEPTIEEQDKIKQYKNSVAESLASFSFNVLLLALLNRSLYLSGNLTGCGNIIASSWHYLAYFGTLNLLISISIYLEFPSHKLQKWLVTSIFNPQNLKVIKYVGWTIVLVLFGISLQAIQEGWAAILGQICILAGIATLAYVLVKSIVSKKEVQAMGSKGRKNVKKAKQPKEKKQQPEAKKK